MLTINLAAIQDNWSFLNALASPAKVAGVIKANAYGLGTARVAQALFQVGCREFFVASLDEALSAKQALPDSALIYVLGGLRSGDEPFFFQHKFIPVLCSAVDLKRWADANSSLSSPAPSAIKINTGMTRLGLDFHELRSACADSAHLKLLNPVLLMSHLACAEDLLHPLNELQKNKFIECATLIRQLVPGIRLSLANSSGIFLGKDWHFDLVRPGAALYGIAPQPGNVNPLKPVIELKLPIIQVRHLVEASSLGYKAEGQLPEGGCVAVVAGGYADGLNRTAGRAPEGILCGQLVRAIGRMSMDLTMFDLSGVVLPDEALLQSHIEIINDSLSLDYLSNKNNLLGYEVLTSLGHRYKRVYLEENL